MYIMILLCQSILILRTNHVFLDPLFYVITEQFIVLIRYFMSPSAYIGIRRLVQTANSPYNTQRLHQYTYCNLCIYLKVRYSNSSLQMVLMALQIIAIDVHSRSNSRSLSIYIHSFLTVASAIIPTNNSVYSNITNTKCFCSRCS